jgi:two-component system, chemotaxis family, protein-glutamate methylesterase/glutaminase
MIAEPSFTGVGSGVGRRDVAALVIGGSAGGLEALSALLSAVGPEAAFPIVCVLHVHADGPNLLPTVLSHHCVLPVKEAESTEELAPGQVYFAPADYHLTIEPDRTFALSNDPPVNFSRPSIDVLFESAADAYGVQLVGILLTGANADGAAGLRQIKRRGGFAIVQDPATAEFPDMPRSAIGLFDPDAVMAVPAIAALLGRLSACAVLQSSGRD